MHYSFLEAEWEHLNQAGVPTHIPIEESVWKTLITKIETKKIQVLYFLHFYCFCVLWLLEVMSLMSFRSELFSYLLKYAFNGLLNTT